MRCDEGGRGASLHYPTSTRVQLLNVRMILDTVHRTTDDTMGRYGLIHPRSTRRRNTPSGCSYE